MKHTLRALVPTWMSRGDLALFRAVAQLHSPALDAVLPRLSRAANHSKLWMAWAVVLTLTGGRRGRRAALRGLVGVALNSTIVNLPLKLALGRGRPPADLVPQARRLRRMPTSRSLPSGHSASAAAFATAVAVEHPVASVPVGTMAAAVAFSRIYVGAHYPADVLVGTAIGAGMGVATAGWWPVAPSPEDAPPAQVRTGAVAPMPEGEGLVCCVNRSAGSLWSPAHSSLGDLERLPDAQTLITRHLPRAKIVVCSGEDLATALDQAAPDATAIGAAGGDGSVSAAAQVAHRRGIPLLVVPTGTHNHLARDVGLDRPSDPLEAVRTGETLAVDLASAADRPFVNAASLGSYASMVALRERWERRIGKWPALLWALLWALRHDQPITVDIDGRRRRLWMLFAGNCRYEPEGFAPAWRSRLDDGQLDIRLVDAEIPWARVRLVFSVLTGRLGRCRAYREWTAPSVKVRSWQGPLALACDGEVSLSPEEFDVVKLDGQVEVYAPRP